MAVPQASPCHVSKGEDVAAVLFCIVSVCCLRAAQQLHLREVSPHLPPPTVGQLLSAGDLFRELVGQAAEAKDQLEVVGAGGQPYSFQFTIRSDNGTCTLSVSVLMLGCAHGCCFEGPWAVLASLDLQRKAMVAHQHPALSSLGCSGCLQGAQLGRWGADTGAQAGDSVALRRNGGHVEVRLIPASGTAAGQAAAGSPSPAPAPAAAQAGGAAARRTRRSSTEEQEQKQSRAPAAPAAAAGAGGKGSKRRSSERQEQQGGAAAAAAAAAPAAGSGKRGSKRASSERQQQGGSPASAPAAAGSTGHFPSGGTAPHKGWQMGGDGWWRRPLTASACGTSQSCVKLGFPGAHRSMALRLCASHVWVLKYSVPSCVPSPELLQLQEADAHSADRPQVLPSSCPVSLTSLVQLVSSRS